jgi:hypothetical protein
MKHSVTIAALACAIVGAVRSPSAYAQTAPPPPPPVMVERPVLPNPVLFRGGLALFTVGYIPAVTVAFFSDHKGDANLFIPVAGPWIDLATRDCSGSTYLTMDGPVEVGTGYRCGTTGTDQAALILDGVVQGMGAVAFIGSLVIPERTQEWARLSPFPNVSFSPTSFSGRGMGAVAAGRF